MSDITSQVPPSSPPVQVKGPYDSDVIAWVARQPKRGLRLWPGVVIILLQWLAIKLPGWVQPDNLMLLFTGMFWGPMVAALLILGWWLGASRLRWFDRLLVPLVCIFGAAVAYLVCDPTLKPKGYPFGHLLFGVPVVLTVWVGWLVLTPPLRWPARRVGLLAAVLLAWGYFTLLRFDGVFGNMDSTITYRFLPTAEERYEADEKAGKIAKDTHFDPKAARVSKVVSTDWPGFRGPNRDGRRPGVRIATDWKQNPPRELWRHRVGPGWSSFAVVGTNLFTQEQHVADEVVVCYNADTGARRWLHADKVRFSETVGGDGPRATPTYHDGKLYTLGATGLLNCLDAATGDVKWSKDIVKDSGAAVPDWGFAASPLVVEGVVIVFAGARAEKDAPTEKSLLGYKASSGDLAWSAGVGRASYSSPHLARLGGLTQVLIATDAGITSLNPANGSVYWKNDWPAKMVVRVTQPTILENSDLLYGTGMNTGTRRFHVGKVNGKWTADEVFTSRAISPYFNDMVAHKGHVYGFDGMFLTCVSVEDGNAKWRERGYGNGQVLLLPDQDLLLITTEKTGEVALVEASPSGRHELGRFKALEGKTWNHPVVAGGKLFVRNAEEAACFQLSVEEDLAKDHK